MAKCHYSYAIRAALSYRGSFCNVRAAGVD